MGNWCCSYLCSRSCWRYLATTTPVPPMHHRSSPLHYGAPLRLSPPTVSARVPGLVASSDSEPESENSSDTDTWGGTFSLRHTRRQEEQVEPPTTDATIVTRLTSRTLYALTDYLGIPHTLRPCFAVEAARLQLSLALFSHQSISCDRNCEGDESDSDSETSISSRHPTWLPDSEDLRRVRRFLSSPGPDFHHSTDSESESSGI